MANKHAKLRSALTKAIVDFFIHEDLYSDELRIQGTLCVTADQNAIFVTQITETISDSYDGDVLDASSGGESKPKSKPMSDCLLWNARDPIDYSASHEGRNHGSQNTGGQSSSTKPTFVAPKPTAASDTFDRLDNLTSNRHPAHSNTYILSNTSHSSTSKVPSAGSYNTLNSPPGGDKPLPLVNNRNSHSASSHKITSKHDAVTNSFSEMYNPNKILNNKRCYNNEPNSASSSQLPSSLMQRQSSFLGDESYEDSFLSSFSPRLNESLMSPLSKKLKTEPVDKDSKLTSSKDQEEFDKAPDVPELSRAKLMELLQGVAGRVTSPPLLPRDPLQSVTSPSGERKESKGSSPPPAPIMDGDNGILSSSPQPFSPPPAHLLSDSSGFGSSFAWPLSSVTSSANYNADWQMNSWVRKPKTKFTPEQLQLLENEYQIDPFLSTCADRRATLARKLNLTEKNIQIWFQNQRRRRRAAAYSRMHHMFNSTSDTSGSQLPLLPPDVDKSSMEFEVENQRDESDLRPTSDLEDSLPDDSPLVLDESKENEPQSGENAENVSEPSKCAVSE